MRILQLVRNNAKMSETPFTYLTLDPNTGRVVIDMRTGGWKVQFSSLLNEIMGFQDKSIHGRTYATYPPRIGFKLMYVYSDLIEPQEVGGQQVPLLATVAVKGQHAETIVERIHDPFYLPVTKRAISRIELQLSRDSLEPIEVGNNF